MTCSSLHSICAGDSATRGGRTTRLGAGVSPASANSSTSGGTSAAVMLAAVAMASLTTLITNSPVSSTLRNVSLRCVRSVLSVARSTGQNSTVGGADPTPQKKLKGARLAAPARSTVDTSATGRHNDAGHDLVYLARR